MAQPQAASAPHPAPASIGVELVAGGSSLLQGWGFAPARGPEQVVVGSDERCEWQIIGHGIARRHLVLHWTGEALWVAPMEAPVVMNGRAIGSWSPVPPGSRLTIGASELSVWSGTPAPQPPPRPSSGLDATCIVEPEHRRASPPPPLPTLDSGAGAGAEPRPPVSDLFVAPPPEARVKRRGSRHLAVIGLVVLAFLAGGAVWLEEVQARKALEKAGGVSVISVEQTRAAGDGEAKPRGEALAGETVAAARRGPQSIVDGRYREALHAYRQLARNRSDERVYEVIVRLLERKVESPCETDPQSAACSRASSSP